MIDASLKHGEFRVHLGAPLDRQLLKGRALASINLSSPRPVAGAGTHRLLWFQVYVQDLLQQQLAGEVLHVLHKEQGHLYVCGDVRMAQDVAHALKQLVAAKLSLSEEQVEDYFLQLKVWQLVCGLGMQVKGMGQGARTRGVRLRTVLDLKGP